MGRPALTVQAIRDRCSRVPRLVLLTCPRRSKRPRVRRQIGNVRVFVERDDCTGLLFGGNKVRTRNSSWRTRSTRTVMSSSGRRRAIEQLPRHRRRVCPPRTGMPAYLSRTTGPADVQGNLLLDHLVGAKSNLWTRRWGQN